MAIWVNKFKITKVDYSSNNRKWEIKEEELNNRPVNKEIYNKTLFNKI
jgi:hypothetical protein